jgi:multimeric flavodoxin WrbA
MLTALAFNCTLKKSPQTSSTEKLMLQFLTALESQDVRGEMVRPVDYDIKPGITSDEGPGDAWPDLRKRVMKADIIVVGSPIWLGQPSSVAKRVLERMDAFLGEKDDFGRMPSYGKVGVVNAVGNEDRAHHVAAEALQALIEVGFSVPPGGVAYWVGEAMGSVNYIDLKNTPEALADWINMLAANTAHLARILKDCPFPGRPQGIPN